MSFLTTLRDKILGRQATSWTAPCETVPPPKPASQRVAAVLDRDGRTDAVRSASPHWPSGSQRIAHAGPCRGGVVRQADRRLRAVNVGPRVAIHRPRAAAGQALRLRAAGSEVPRGGGTAGGSCSIDCRIIIRAMLAFSWQATRSPAFSFIPTPTTTRDSPRRWAWFARSTRSSAIRTVRRSWSGRTRRGSRSGCTAARRSCCGCGC